MRDNATLAALEDETAMSARLAKDDLTPFHGNVFPVHIAKILALLVV